MQYINVNKYNNISVNARTRQRLVMKTLFTFATVFITMFTVTAYSAEPIDSALSTETPKCTQSDMWTYVINNAYRTADEYATSKNNLRSTFATMKEVYTFEKQTEGEHEGAYLLTITNNHGKDTSIAILSPLFDVNESSKDLDDSKPLWAVVSASLNGAKY